MMPAMPAAHQAERPFAAGPLRSGGLVERHLGCPSTAPPNIEHRFWRMWIEHHDPLRKMLLRMTRGNMADAEDVLGNAMLKALQQFTAIEGGIRNERAWLTRLVRNVCIDHYRSVWRVARWVEEAVQEEIFGSEETQGTREPTPEERLAAAQAIRDLDTLLSRMPENLRRPLVMRFLEEKSYDEIAGELGLSAVNVRKRIQLARDFLKRHGLK